MVFFEFDARPSDSPFVDQVWCARSESSGIFQSIATNQSQMVVTLRNGKSTFTVRGPETGATPLSCDAGGGSFAAERNAW